MPEKRRGGKESAIRNAACDCYSSIRNAACDCYPSTTPSVLDAVGAQPDAQYRVLVEPELQQVLTVGRPIEQQTEAVA